MERRAVEYLDSQEQLRIGALVNRLCEVAPEEFVPATHVEAAREIIRALDPKIEATKSRFTASASFTSESESSVMSGATDQGNVSTSFDERKKREVRFGKILEYRIGMYVAIKRDKGGRSMLFLQHFWDRGEINEVFEQEEPTTEIQYRRKDLEPVSITKLVPKPKTFWVVTMTTYQRINMWKAE